MAEPLSASNGRVKEARKLSRRPVRAERRLFLADGPNAVEGALSSPGCAVEVFATPAATSTYAALVDAAGRAGVPWTPVDDRALTSLSDSVTPAGVVAVCRFLDVPLTESSARGGRARHDHDLPERRSSLSRPIPGCWSSAPTSAIPATPAP